jgi:hypothetical protein
VLGLQGALSVRAYDYDERRPIYNSWQDVVVETVAVRYVRDEHGLVRFTTFGGGVRISEEKLHEFNDGFLKIPKDAVSKRRFDLDKLRDLCFGRFSDRLYKLRFSNPSGLEYRSIDHALFQSRKYIDPEAERLREIRADLQVKIEAFDSDIPVATTDLVVPVWMCGSRSRGSRARCACASRRSSTAPSSRPLRSRCGSSTGLSTRR